MADFEIEPVQVFQRGFSDIELERRFDLDLVSALVGMPPRLVRRILSIPNTRVTLRDTLTLLDHDAFCETFLPRRKIPGFLLRFER